MTTKTNEINQVAETIERNLQAANEAIDSAMRMLEANSVAEWAFLNGIRGEIRRLPKHYGNTHIGYFGTEFGNIIKLDRSTGTIELLEFGKQTGGAIGKSCSSAGGYHMKALATETGYRPFYAHRVIAETFILNGEPIPKGLVVDHLDFNKTNNAVSNLELVTQQENMRRYSAKKFG